MLTPFRSGALILRIGLGGNSQEPLLTGSAVPLTPSRGRIHHRLPRLSWRDNAAGWGCSAKGRSQVSIERQLQTQGQQEALHSPLGKDGT